MYGPNSYKLLGMLMGHAPNRACQAFMSAKYAEVCAQITVDFESGWDLQVEKTLVGMLNDGLSHGNWPWMHILQAQSHEKCADPECAVDHSVTVRPK